MDLTPYFSGVIAAVLAYIAMRIGNERHFASIESKQASQDERIAQALEEAHIGRELSIQIAAISAKMDDLAEDVRKHNGIVERTVVLERDMTTLWKRHDELRDELHDLKVGGTI